MANVSLDPFVLNLLRKLKLEAYAENFRGKSSFTFLLGSTKHFVTYNNTVLILNNAASPSVLVRHHRQEGDGTEI